MCQTCCRCTHPQLMVMLMLCTSGQVDLLTRLLLFPLNASCVPLMLLLLSQHLLPLVLLPIALCQAQVHLFVCREKDSWQVLSSIHLLRQGISDEVHVALRLLEEHQ